MSGLDGTGTAVPNGINVPANKLFIAGTAVTATAAEINAIDGVATGAIIVGSRFAVSLSPIVAASVGQAFFIAPAACKIISAYEVHGTACDTTDTLTIEKCNSGDDAGGGDVALATAWTLNSTVNVPVSVAAVTDGKQVLVAGDSLMLKFASGDGTTYAQGAVTVLMQWI